MKEWCNPKPGNGFALILHNIGTNIVGGAGEGNGYAGLSNVVVIDLDIASEDNDLVKPHVSIEFNGADPIGVKHTNSLAGGHMKQDVADGKVHKMKVMYEKNVLWAKRGPGKGFQVK